MLAQCISCIVLELVLFYNLTVLKSRYVITLQYLFLAANYADMYVRSTYNPSFLRSSYNVLEMLAFTNMTLLVTIVCFSQGSPHHHMFTGFQVLDMLVLIITFLRYAYRCQRGFKLKREHERFSAANLQAQSK